MDPNEALKNARDAVRAMDAGNGPTVDEMEQFQAAAEDLRNAFYALDDWLSKGGFKPADWEFRRNAQSNPGPDEGQPDLMPERACEDAYGTEYIPWTDGWAVGFKVVPPDGVAQWLYLNPSSTDEGSERPTSNVFLYHDEDEGRGPHYSGALIHVETYEPSDDERDHVETDPGDNYTGPTFREYDE